MDTVGGMALFVQVVDSNGFKAASRILGLSPSAVSKQMASLEERLGARLLNRTTRRIGLTEEGEAYYRRCTRILEEINLAEQEISASGGTPRGLLRVSVPISFGQSRIAPLLPGFLERYPRIRLSVFAQDRMVDMIEEGYDVAVRVARLDDSSMIARRLTGNRRVICATPRYFDARGMPDTPGKLVEHNCLVNTAYSPQRNWLFRKGGKQHSVRVSGNLEFTNPQALREAALGGLGVGLLPAYLVEPDLAAGRLRGVLEGYVSQDPDVYVIYPHAKYLSPRVRVFVDFLLEAFQDAP